MAKLIKLRYIMLALLAVAVIVSATAFSVSYAKWAGGVNTFSISATTGEWGSLLSKMGDDVIVSAVEEKAKEIAGWLDNKYGGIMINDENGIHPAAWRNSTLGSTKNGYTTEPLSLKKGDTFVVVFYSFVWNYGGVSNNGLGKCTLTADYADKSDCFIRLDSDLTDNKKYKVFTVLKDCTIILDVRESGTGKNDDNVTVKGSGDTPAVSVYYPQ